MWLEPKMADQMADQQMSKMHLKIEGPGRAGIVHLLRAAVADLQTMARGKGIGIDLSPHPVDIGAPPAQEGRDQTGLLPRRRLKAQCT